MSYPKHPKAAQIERMLLEMESSKAIKAQLNISDNTLKTTRRRLGMLRVALTYEERLLIAQKRGINPNLIPNESHA